MKARWIFALLLLLAWIGGIGWRLYQLQVRDHEEYQGLAKRQQLRRITLEPHRGTIYDARGRLVGRGARAGGAARRRGGDG